MTELVKSLGIEWPILVAQIINFAILLAVLGKFVYKPVMKILDERRTRIAQTLLREEHSAQKLASAEADKENILSEARNESQKLLEIVKHDGEEMKRKLVASAKEEIAKMHTDAQIKQRNERARLLLEVKKEIGELIVSTIEKTLGDVLDARTQGKMVEQALAAIREEGIKKS